MTRFGALYGLLAGVLASSCGGLGLEETHGAGIIGFIVAVFPETDISFGEVSPHGFVAEQTVIFRGTGDSAGVVQKIFFEGGNGVFTVLDNPAPFRLDVDESRTLTVEFAPASQRTFSATMAVEVKGAETSWVERGVDGIGCKDQNEDGRCEQSGPSLPQFDSGELTLDAP